MKPAVVFQNVTKSFPKFSWRLKPSAPIPIFSQLSFKVYPGEIFGILGPNGAGKTTILKLASSITYPDSGSVTTKGTTAPLIEIGAGFHPEMTGRENIYLYGQLLGLTFLDLKKLEQEIINFAEISDYINQPVKHYSSGMTVRLGFSIAVHSKPNVLLVDEALAVGDAHFAQKSLQKIEELTTNGTAIIFVTHNLYLVGALCRQVMYLNCGVGRIFSNPAQAIKAYQRHLGRHPIPIEKKYDLLPQDHSSPNRAITNLSIKSSITNRPLTKINNDQNINLQANYILKNADLENTGLSLSLVRADGMIYFTEVSPTGIITQNQGTIHIKFTLQHINPAFYAFTLRIVNQTSRRLLARATSKLIEVLSPLDMKERVMGVLVQPIDSWQVLH